MNFYTEAANIVDQLEAKKGSIKGLLGRLPEKSRKRTAALVIETLKYKPVLLDVIKASPLLTRERRVITSQSLALLLVHDLLLGRGIEASDGPIKQAILRHKTRLQSEFVKIKVRRGVKNNEQLAQADDPRASKIPRYVRINTITWTTLEAIESFKARGFLFGEDPLTAPKGFTLDAHVPDLLLFHPNVQFHKDPSYISGKLILQDKASCFPAFVLRPEVSDDTGAIDATAAPGNKTTHLSALMGNKGKIFAFERDRRRFKTLETMLSKAGTKNVQPCLQDFLQVDPEDPIYSGVTHILVDPSCSGSGIVNRLDFLTEHEDDVDGLEERLGKLAEFQTSMVLHACRFPAVKKIVYSTCSVHEEENEAVVSNVLKSEYAKKFTLASPSHVLPTWKRRGHPTSFEDSALAKSVIRCSPDEDGTNGFFVACFVLRSEDPTIGKRKRGAGAKELDLPLQNKPQPKKKKRKRAANGLE